MLVFANSKMTSTRRGARPGDYILHPLILSMLLLWAVNDHLLKDYFANMWTGKLSDIASLAVAPLLPLCFYEIVCGLRRSEPSRAPVVFALSLLAVGSLMVGINTSAAVGEGYRVGLGALQWPFRCLIPLLTGAEIPRLTRVFLTPDPSDLITLPALLIPYWVVQRAPRL
jgi:hypothetical protein